jgi:hypothetical protein
MTELEVETTSNSTNITNITNIEYYPIRWNQGIAFPSLFAIQGSNRLLFGGGQSSHVSLKRNNTTLEVKRGDDSNFTSIAAGDTFHLYKTYTDVSNYERLNFRWDGDVAKIGTQRAGTGVARDLVLETDGTERMRVAATGAVTFGGISTTVPAQFGDKVFIFSNKIGVAQISNTYANGSVNLGFFGANKIGLNRSAGDAFVSYNTGTGTSELDCVFSGAYSQLSYLGTAKLRVGSGNVEVLATDIEVTDSTKGIILKSPNGTRYRFTVSDLGTLTPTAL